MYFARYATIALALFLGACGGMLDDIRPSGEDKRVMAEAESAGTKEGQKTPDFTLSTIYGASFNLYSELQGADAVVLYFTMWCPICDSHMSHMRSRIASGFPNVRFVLVDYVSGSVDNARSAASSSGYANGVFTVIADVDQHVLNLYGATMGTTVVIDASGTVRMNEDYKNGGELLDTLEAL